VVEIVVLLEIKDLLVFKEQTLMVAVVAMVALPVRSI
jgi:hypothetical protein